MESNNDMIETNIASMQTAAMTARVQELLTGVESSTLISVLKTLSPEHRAALKEAAKHL